MCVIRRTVGSNAANFSSFLKSVGSLRAKLMQQIFDFSKNESNIKSSAQTPSKVKHSYSVSN